MEKRYKYYHDAGHGWLRVKLVDLLELGLDDKVTNCSYMDDEYVYLEHDCDAPLFINKSAVIESQVDIAYPVDDSFIRNLQSYNKSKLKFELTKAGFDYVESNLL